MGATRQLFIELKTINIYKKIKLKIMKKFFIYAIICAGLIITNKADAQQGFSVSVKGTPQFSFLQNKNDNDNSSYSRKATFNTNFGVGAGYNFTKYLGVGIDALYSLQGQKYTLNTILNTTEYNQKIDYVKVPVYFTYNSDASKIVSFIGKVGPQVSFLTNAKLTDNNSGKTLDDTKDRYKTTAFGGAAVAGVQFKIQPQLYVTAAARFDYDFTNAEDKNYVNYIPGRAKTYNSTAGLEVGLKYLLK